MSMNPDFIGIDGVEFYFMEAEAPKGQKKAEIDAIETQKSLSCGLMPSTLPYEKKQEYFEALRQEEKENK